ncbi:MAG: hypothetical protein LUF87_09700 [Alistipes sp.]|nr:hypothetical protein [Alistipes sp.]
MKNPVLFMLICLASLSPCKGQDLETAVRNCETYFIDGDSARFEQWLCQLYPAFLKANLPEYGMAVQAASAGRFEEAFANLYSLADEDLFLDSITEDGNFTALHPLPQWQELLDYIREKTARYDNPVRLNLQRIQNRDQGIRILYMYIEDATLRKAVHDLMEEIDRQSAVEVCAILDRYGWLGSDRIGTEGNETLFLAIQHVADTTVQQRYFPMLEKAVADGDAEGWHLAFLTDRLLMNRGEKQVYGTQKIFSGESAVPYLVPLRDPHSVDRLRAELGMEPLAEDLAEDGIKWDLEDYLRNLPETERQYENFKRSRGL